MNTKSLCTCAALALLAATQALAHGDGHGAAHHFDAAQVEPTAFGQEGDPAKATRTVRVEMSDTLRFSPDSISVRRGETVKFVVHNGGQVLHEMVLGTPEALKAHAELMKKFPDMEHADANMAHVKPGKNGEIVWQFTQAGRFEFACLQPGHFEAGMVGSVTVK
ncbi:MULTISPECIES: cupredoxin family protein [Ramlibacter]|uniref:Cupredoxin family protein n=1 Tax=Ramlibacter aquaticus TaxID=2780094 RepID=A0ABR9SH83_9BURK|nr:MULTISPECIES: cupredoxin family protein [Ramlibacter]MBE7941239.1 cupredoxin family protein [Ramlibacter aquaticus]